MSCATRIVDVEYLEDEGSMLFVRGHYPPAHLYRALLKGGDIEDRPSRIVQAWWRWVPAPVDEIHRNPRWGYRMEQSTATGPGPGAFAVTEVWL